MSIGVKLYNFLSGNAAITSPPLSGRIYPVVAPDNTQKPYLTFRVVSDSSEYTLDGNSGLGNKTIQVSVIFEDYSEANSIVETIEQAIASWPTAEPDIQVITKKNHSELYDETFQVKRMDLEYEVFAKK